MTTLNHYLGLLADSARVRAYGRAIRQVVEPGCVVADIGAGIGTFSVAAALAGAAEVYAVEAQDIAPMISELAKANGVGDRVRVVHGSSLTVDVPQPADVCMFDAYELLHPSTARRTLADARARWLKPAGHLIPQRTTLVAAPLEQLPTIPGLPPPALESVLGVDGTWLTRLANNTPWPVHLPGDDVLLSPGQAVGQIFDHGDDIDVTITGDASRDGTVRGIACWLDIELTDDERLLTGPGSTITAYPHAVFPLAQPFAVEAGEPVEINLRYAAPNARSGQHRLWFWTVRGRHAEASGSTFATLPLPI